MIFYNNIYFAFLLYKYIFFKLYFYSKNIFLHNILSALPRMKFLLFLSLRNHYDYYARWLILFRHTFAGFANRRERMSGDAESGSRASCN